MFSYSIQYLQRFSNTFQVPTPVHMYEYVTKVITSCIIVVIIVIGRLCPTLPLKHILQYASTFETLPLTYLSGFLSRDFLCIIYCPRHDTQITLTYTPDLQYRGMVGTSIK